MRKNIMYSTLNCWHPYFTISLSALQYKKSDRDLGIMHKQKPFAFAIPDFFGGLDV